MFRSILKFGIKSSYVAYDKIKYRLGCLQEDIEDILAEVKSEIRQDPPAYTQAETASINTVNTANTANTVNMEQNNPSNPHQTQRKPDQNSNNAKDATLC